MINLPDEIIHAIKQYYKNRFLQTQGTRWNKTQDLINIDIACKPTGWVYTAVAGTFFFTKKLQDGGMISIKINEEVINRGGVAEIWIEGVWIKLIPIKALCGG